MKLKIGLWSADYGRLTGQALVTARVRQQQTSLSWSDYIYSGNGWRGVVSWISATIRLWLDIVRGRVVALYLVGSRSNAGFLRDVPALLAAHAGVRTIVHVHGADIVELLTCRRISAIARSLYTHCEIIVPSKHLLPPLSELVVGPVHLCENFVAGESTTSQHGLPYRSSKELFILWNSNVMASKGFFDLIAAVEQLQWEGLAVKVIGIGDPLGDEEVGTRETRSRLGLLCDRAWFDYRGRLQPSDVDALVVEVDVVALPSRYASECQPLAIIQAMCASRAIIVTDTPALRATLGNYPAHFVPVHSIEAIGAALRELYRAKLHDPVAFASARQEGATVARKRFARKRFDREIEEILMGGV